MGFFKAYDMRGTFGKDFDLSLVGRVGQALPKVVGGRRWLVGRDCRETSPAVRDALVAGLQAAGAEVTDLGLATTPMVYFATVSSLSFVPSPCSNIDNAGCLQPTSAATVSCESFAAFRALRIFMQISGLSLFTGAYYGLYFIKFQGRIINTINIIINLSTAKGL